MYVDWEYYKIFYYVAKYQNFTKAARVLGNNQPNITHSMNRLESQLNCVLFIRSNRGVTLTPEGEMLYSRIASAAVQIQDDPQPLGEQVLHGPVQKREDLGLGADGIGVEKVAPVHGQAHVIEAPVLDLPEIRWAEEGAHVLQIARESVRILLPNGIDLTEPSPEIHTLHQLTSA